MPRTSLATRKPRRRRAAVLTSSERRLLASFERGDWSRVPNDRRLKALLRRAAIESRQGHQASQRGKMNWRPLGSTLDAYLKKEGSLEEFQAKAVKENIAWRLANVRQEGRFASAEIHQALFPKRPRARSLEELKGALRKSVRRRHARR